MLEPACERVVESVFGGQAVRPRLLLKALLAVAPKVGVVRPGTQDLEVREQKPPHSSHQPPLLQLPRQLFADRVTDA